MITCSKLRNTLGPSLFLIASLMPGAADAQVSGTVRVTARDQQNLVLPAVDVTIKAKTSTLSQAATTGADGEAVFPVVPAGEYVVSAHLEGFATVEREVIVLSNIVTPVQLQLGVAGLAQAVEVTALTVNPESTRTANTVQRDDIQRQPDVDRSGSLAMITNNTPGAYMLHDLLHVRGGHAVSWEIDGVPVPSSALATVGSQFDPKDISSLEINRGGLPTNLGDRRYSVFNVVPRSGFEGERFAELTGSYGSYQLGNGHFAFGDHSENQKFAYFGSVSANRTDFGLERVDPTVLHDTAYSFSGFTSIIYNKSRNDQLRFVSAVRTDQYQVAATCP